MTRLIPSVDGLEARALMSAAPIGLAAPLPGPSYLTYELENVVISSATGGPAAAEGKDAIQIESWSLGATRTAPGTYGDLLPAVREADPAGGNLAGVFVGVPPGDDVQLAGWDVVANKKL